MLKKATVKDANAYIKVKNSLKMILTDNSQQGFLLGTSLEKYQWFIKNAYVITIANTNVIEGFGIVLPDMLVKTGEIWEKRNEVDWDYDLSLLETQKVAYFEQLALRKGNKRNMIQMVYHLIDKAFQEGHELLLTTTVVKPKLNLAAVPMILRVGGKTIGAIDEVYEGVGNIKSNIYMIEKEVFYAHVAQLPFADWLLKKTFDWK